MSIKIQIRRGTSSEWDSANPTLASGELGYDSTNDILKVGDGSSPWNSLPDSDDQNALQTAYDATGQTFALGATVQDAIHAIDDELIVQDGRLDVVQGDASTSGSIAKAEADARAHTDTRESAITTAYNDAIDAAKLALGTNFSVADITARDALVDLTVGDIVFVADNGDGKFAQYKVTVASPNEAFLKIMDEDILLNALSAANIKSAYEGNDDTNAFTDALLSKVNAIEVNAKDDQNAAEVPFNNTASGLIGATVQAAIDEVDDRVDTAEADIDAVEGRLNIVEADENTVGSIAKALKEAKDHADAQDALQDDADEISYVDTSQTYALGSNVQLALYAVDDELIAQDGRLDVIEGSGTGSIAKALQDAQDYADAQDALKDDADEISYDATGQTFALGVNVQAAIHAIDDELITQDSRLDTIQGNDQTAGSIERALKDAKDHADNEIILAKTALGTNFVVADIAARDALTDLVIGDNVFVEDAGNQRFKQFKVTGIDPVVFTLLMDQSVLINAIDGPGVKSIYESNADTNAFTDALLSKVNAIEANAKDDQNADEVPFTSANLSSADVQAAIDEVYNDVFTSKVSNTVLAGPTSGADGAASFRTLVEADIPSLNASIIATGTLSDERLPNLEAAKITTGTFDVARIPNLDAARIPDLDAAKITTGTLDVARIPDLSANKITTDTLGVDRIPTLAQSKITDLETDLGARVVGPASATNANFATFDGTTGKLVADSGFSATSFAKISIGSTEPVSPSAGDLWFNNDAAVKNLFFYDGTDWVGVNTYQ